MESMAYVEHSSPMAGALLEFVGDLKLLQAQPVNHKGIDVTYNVGIIHMDLLYVSST